MYKYIVYKLYICIILFDPNMHLIFDWDSFARASHALSQSRIPKIIEIVYSHNII